MYIYVGRENADTCTNESMGRPTLIGAGCFRRGYMTDAQALALRFKADWEIWSILNARNGCTSILKQESRSSLTATRKPMSAPQCSGRPRPLLFMMPTAIGKGGHHAPKGRGRGHRRRTEGNKSSRPASCYLGPTSGARTSVSRFLRSSQEGLMQQAPHRFEAPM